MAPQTASWSDTDTNALITFLVTQLPTVADGTGFKPTVWNEAALVINALTKTKGAEKTSSSCKSKFARVCLFSDFLFLLSMTFFVYL
jgi:hypothetical protein